MCIKLVYIWLQVLFKGAYTCHKIHDEIFAEFDFEAMHYNLEWQGKILYS